MKYTTIINDQQYDVEILRDGRISVNGVIHEVDFMPLEEGNYFSILKDLRSVEVAIEEQTDGSYELLMGGRLFSGRVYDERAMLMMNRAGGLKVQSGEVVSPMPGLIVQVLVSPGDEVLEGQTLVILESMKMQNELKASRAGHVAHVNCMAGASVDKGATLLVIGD